MTLKLSQRLDILFENRLDVEYENEYFRIISIPTQLGEYLAFDPKRDTVSVLGFKGDSGVDGQCLIRKEDISAWDYEDKSRPYHYCCIRGGVKKGESDVLAAKRELEEESGYKITGDRLYDLGQMYHSKESTASTHLFAADLNNLQRFNSEGDGSVSEVKSSNEWLSLTECCTDKVKDPLVQVSILRLIGKFIG